MRIDELDVLERLARLPDDVALNTAEAAVFLRTSVTTLERYRRSGEGPVYSQGGGAGAKGTNQKCLYVKADLKAWVASNRVSSSLEAAVRRGQMYSTAADLAEPVAFWRNPKGQLAGMVEETSANLFFARLGLWGIEWISPRDAMADNWESALAQRAFASRLTKGETVVAAAQLPRNQPESARPDNAVAMRVHLAVAVEAGDVTIEQAELLVTRRMPFGKYAGRRIVDLPRPYLEWFSRRGFTNGEIGDLLALMHRVYARKSTS